MRTILTLLLLATLAACGGGDPEDNPLPEETKTIEVDDRKGFQPEETKTIEVDDRKGFQPVDCTNPKVCG